MAIAEPRNVVIIADGVYPLADFMAITRQGQKGIRRLKREGLKVHRQGRCSYIIGRDWLEFLIRQQAK